MTNQKIASLNDSVLGYLRRDFSRLLVNQTAGEALNWLRSHPPDGRVVYLYVVDNNDRLCGVVPTRRLILSSPDTPLVDVMVRQVVALPAEATVLEACEFFIQHRLLALPVVDKERRILGLVDVELYTDEVRDMSDASHRDALFQLVGVLQARGQHASLLFAFRQRFPWLGCNLAAGILAAFLSGVYEKELKGVVALAFFIPVVLNLAESVSSQSVSLALHALQAERPTWGSLLQRFGRELLTGFSLGLATGAIVALAALAWLGHGRLALCLIGGISAGVAVAAAFGLAIPFVLRLLHLEPRVAAGPVSLAVADVVTILAYFNLARWLLG
jgi:magnesium transporter